MKCYFCKVSDPNKIHYNPNVHDVCTLCSVNLWEIAQKGIELDMRDQTIVVRIKKPIGGARKASKLVLSSGYEVDLAEEEGLVHLFNAIVGEVTERVEYTDEFSDRGFAMVFDLCILEIYYVAGQLCHAGSGLGLEKLLDEFRVQWDRIAAKLNTDEDGD